MIKIQKTTTSQLEKEIPYIDEQQDRNNEQLTNIFFQEMYEDLKTSANEYYIKICKTGLVKEEYTNLINTGICGQYEEKIFVIYENPIENNKICILFMDRYEQYLICIDSEQIMNFDSNSKNTIDKITKDYIEKCNYYSIINLNNYTLTETHGLYKNSKNYYKKRIIKNSGIYEILLEKEEDGTYKCEQTKIEQRNTRKLELLWENYEEFEASKESKKIKLSIEEKKYFKPNFKINTNLTYTKGEEQYEQIKEHIKENGFTLNCKEIIKYIKRGEQLNDGIIRIINYYIMEQASKQMRKKIIQTKNPKFDQIEDTEEETILKMNAGATRYSNIQKRK